MSEYTIGQYAAVFYEDNSTGDHDKIYIIAKYCDHFGRGVGWRSVETMQMVPGEYVGDRILMIWLLDKEKADFNSSTIFKSGDPCSEWCIKLHTKCARCGRWGARGEGSISSQNTEIAHSEQTD